MRRAPPASAASGAAPAVWGPGHRSGRLNPAEHRSDRRHEPSHTPFNDKTNDSSEKVTQTLGILSTLKNDALRWSVRFRPAGAHKENAIPDRADRAVISFRWPVEDRFPWGVMAARFMRSASLRMKVAHGVAHVVPARFTNHFFPSSRPGPGGSRSPSRTSASSSSSAACRSALPRFPGCAGRRRTTGSSR